MVEVDIMCWFLSGPSLFNDNENDVDTDADEDDIDDDVVDKLFEVDIMCWFPSGPPFSPPWAYSHK